jgi:magnesium transporter
MSIDSDVDPSEVSTAKRKPSRSWLLIDAAGNSTMLNVDSYAIIRRVHIYARDLRVFESSISSPLSIRTREGAIVLNLEHIKVIITADEVSLLSTRCLPFLLDYFVVGFASGAIK